MAHMISFNDVPWWNVIYPVSITDLYQGYYSDTTNSSYQGLVQAYAGMGHNMEYIKFILPWMYRFFNVIMIHKHYL